MIALLVWTLRAWRWRLVGAWERRGMHRQAPPMGPPPPPTIIVVAVRSPDPHTARLRMQFATGAVPHGRTRPMDYQQYARIARAVRAEHEEEPK